MRTTLAAGLAAGILSLAAAMPAAAVEPGKAELSVLHGVPGLTVDVYVNGALALDDFTPGTLAGPLPFDPGTYAVALTASDAPDASSPVLGPINLTLAADMSYTAVAHLDADGDPTATLFTNDMSAVGAGEGRLTVRHVAAAPAVDILAGGSPIIAGLENPDEAKAVVPATTYSVAVAPAGTTTPVLGPTDLPVTAGVNTIVYAWGSLDGDSLDLAVQTVTIPSASPSGVQAGTQGLADESGSGSSWIVLAGAAALLAAGGAAVALRRREATVNR